MTQKNFNLVFEQSWKCEKHVTSEVFGSNESGNK